MLRARAGDCGTFPADMNDHLYASASRDEVWLLSGEALVRITDRWEAGRAWTRVREDGFEIEATDDFGDAIDLRQRLEEPLSIDSETLARAATRELAGPARVRLLRHARAVVAGDLHDLRFQDTLIVSASGRSIVASSENLAEFGRFLEPPAAAAVEVGDYRSLPIEWADGSAAVLMHEAVGHPAERARRGVSWPEWLSVEDRPGGDHDDCGMPTRNSILTGPNAQLSWRRSSFRDVPLRRMAHLIVSASGVTALPPKDRLRLRLLSGGRYDPIDDTVTIGVVSAERLGRAGIEPIRPFTIRESRTTIAAAMAGECGASVSYPGVACFDQGQRVFVGSTACGLLTRPFGDFS